MPTMTRTSFSSANVGRLFHDIDIRGCGRAFCRKILAWFIIEPAYNNYFDL